MERLTIRVPEELLEEIERIQDADDVSQSEAARQLLRRGSAYDEVKTERDRLERQYRQLIEQREEHTELVEYVEEERDLKRQRERQRDRRRTAPVWRRAKWWFLGEPDSDLEGDAGELEEV